jgi:hypothetical protein
MVVLNEGGRQTVVAKERLLIAFDKEAAIICFEGKLYED